MEHDGLHFAEGVFDFSALFQMVQSPTALLKAVPGDFAVFVGVTPQDFGWYLRFYLDHDAEENERTGRFDLTLQQELIEAYKHDVIRPLQIEMHEQEAGEYYQSIRL